MEMEQQYNLTGRLLVATPLIGDEQFEKSIVFVCMHGEEGTVGVVINKPFTTVTHNEICEQLNMEKSGRKNPKYTIFRGGPVDNDRLFVLSVSMDEIPDHDGSMQSISGLTLYTNAPAFLADVARGVRKEKFMLCLGFSAWTPGQLEQEIEENSWLVVNATPEDVFEGDPKKKWQNISNSLGIEDPYKMVPYSGHA
jgi:putative transcriptional regulator